MNLQLRRRFEVALQRAGATRPTSGLVDRLFARYLEPHRHYHTLSHVEACLEVLDRNPGLATRPAEVELALWFHDVVYDPRAKDNELRSAKFAGRVLLEAGLEDSSIRRIEQHILATSDHAATDQDSKLVVAIDLAILGAAPEAFDVFEQQVRREYGHVPDLLFVMARRRVLKRFFERPVIYEVPELRDQLEARARANLGRALGSR